MPVGLSLSGFNLKYPGPGNTMAQMELYFKFFWKILVSSSPQALLAPNKLHWNLPKYRDYPSHHRIQYTCILTPGAASLRARPQAAVRHLESWLVVRTRYNPVRTALYLSIVSYHLVLLRLSTYFLPQVRTWYVLFIPSTYWVRTSQISMYLVRT